MAKNKASIIGSVVILAACVLGGTLMFSFINGAFGDFGSHGNNENPNQPGDNTHKDDFSTVIQTEGEYSKYTYESLTLNTNYFPITPNASNGKKANILVVPVEFKDYKPFSSAEINYIEEAFNGTGEKHETKSWESCKSFYYKSSNGHLDMDFTITDTFIPSISASKFISMIDDYGTESGAILDEITTKGLKDNGQMIDLQSPIYDINNDKYIDGVWMIYNARSVQDVYQNQHFWAYTTDYYPSINIPQSNNVFGKYANCSILLLDDAGDIRDLTDPDAHTIIHETGHMLGLDDYYDYYQNSTQFSYTGQVDMMDLNIGDHNAFSKYALGWTKAKVVDKKETITLKPFSKSFDSIILPSASYNGSAFSEYIMIEYYTPEGLFNYDSTHKFGGPQSGYPYTFRESGLRMYHVDARLAVKTITSNGGSFFGNYLGKNDTLPQGSFTEIKGVQKLTYPTITHTNSPEDTSRNKDGKPLIELISATGQRLYGARGAVNKDLFKENALGGVAFNKTTHRSYFRNGIFNDGSSMNYSVAIDNISPEGITITIDRT